MINVVEESTCCGCTACSSICPHHAITMKPDKLGFMYPEVSEENCVDCGLCNNVCQFHENYNCFDNYKTPLPYQFRLTSNEQLKKSQSGGAFYALAVEFMAGGGVVYGAAFSDMWTVKHIKATNINEISALRMSKYVQSDIRGVFSQIKNDLKSGVSVLFSGTACQVAGLKAYIPNQMHNKLCCIDIVCHGVPSPKIWEDYIQYLELSRKSKIVKACFRDKRFGWHGATESFLFENGKEEFRNTNNYLYFMGLTMRESCSKCYFTNFRRVGDITIGDQWGVSKDSPLEDDKGLSLILVNSEKGKTLLENISLSNMIKPISFEQCLQPQLQRPSTMNYLCNKFRKDYENRGFLYIAKKYSDIGFRYKIKKIIENIKNIIRRLLNKWI